VLGPLVVAGISIEEDKMDELKRLGVKDSKSLTPSRREALNRGIREIEAEIVLVKIQPPEIDRTVRRGEKYRRLNFLEAQAMAEVIAKLRPSIAFVDSCDVSCDRFRRQILEELEFNLPIISEHKADKTYPIVSAASILAKVERDRCIRSIRRRWKDIGSGYPSDRKTVVFLNESINSGANLPRFVRKSWRTVRRILETEQI
jgi:ribonuclease HII